MKLRIRDIYHTAPNGRACIDSAPPAFPSSPWRGACLNKLRTICLQVCANASLGNRALYLLASKNSMRFNWSTSEKVSAAIASSRPYRNSIEPPEVGCILNSHGHRLTLLERPAPEPGKAYLTICGFLNKPFSRGTIVSSCGHGAGVTQCSSIRSISYPMTLISNQKWIPVILRTPSVHALLRALDLY